MPVRRYNEKELAAILREAGKRQLAASSPGDERGGYSLEEIQQFASEIGIDPQHVSAVAAKVSDAPATRFLFWGIPPTITAEKTFPGELSDEAWRSMVYEFQTEMGTTGTTSDSARDWKGGGDYLYAYLSARIVKGETRVRLMLKQAEPQGMAWVFGFAGCFVLSLITGIKMAKHGFEAVPIIAAVLACILGMYLLVRTALVIMGSRNQATIDLLTRRIEEIGESSAQPVSPKLESTSATDQLVQGTQ